MKNTLKSPQHKKLKKNFFFGQIRLEFFSYHDQLVDRAVSRVAPIERKSNFVYTRYFQIKYFGGNTVKFRAKDQKCSFLNTSEPSEFYPRRNQLVNNYTKYSSPISVSISIMVLCVKANQSSLSKL